MSFRLAQISDSHLSRAKPFFAGNFERVAAEIRRRGADLVVNSGDMSLDGVGREDDLLEARRLHDGIGPAVRYLAGNHDLGDAHDSPAGIESRIGVSTRERYQCIFGADFWHLDVPGWRLIALNAQLLGSDLHAAAEQMEFLNEAVRGSADRSIALLVHKPLFDASPDEAVVSGRFINPLPRRQLLAAIADSKLALVASGHVHQHRSTMHEGVHYVWAPSTGFVLPDSAQPRYGEKEIGYVEHVLQADGSHVSRFVDVPGSQRLDIADFPDAYPGHTLPVLPKVD
jgi:3',5'-cyclic-AMP phosphodiesterase